MADTKRFFHRQNRQHYDSGLPPKMRLVFLEIEPKEAELVRMIFSDYISGMGQQRIANKINEMGIPTRQGNLWTHPRIREF